VSENMMDTAKMNEKREKRVSTAPESVKMLLRRVFDGKAPRSACIKAMCLECVGFDRLAVTECTAYACPLWNVRPFQPKKARLP
jgi:hypothetical protein